MSDANLRRLQQLLLKYEPEKVYHLAIEELEVAFSTSRRNTSNIIKSLSDEGWICWVPSKGRGNLSQLQIKVTLCGVLEKLFVAELEQGRFSNITRMMELFGETAVKALTLATEKQNQLNEECGNLLITQYPWVDRLQPASTYRLAELQILRSIYNTLLEQDPEGKVQAGLAHCWQVEGRFIHLWLRPEVICHNGKRLEVTQVMDCLNQLMLIDGPVKYLLEQVCDIKVVSRNQLTIELYQANPFFLYILCLPHTSIYGEDKIEFASGLSVNVGTGPFFVKEWDSERLVLKRHNKYYGHSALLDQITLTEASELNDYNLSFNHKEGVVEESMINALSYLAINYRNDAEITQATIKKLLDYVQSQRKNFDSDLVVDDLSFSQHKHKIMQAVPPCLEGHLVITKPKLTIPLLKKTVAWLKDVIEKTGVTVDIKTLENISDPGAMRDQADILFIEEIIEQPQEFGLYDWLLASSGLRFIYDDEAMQKHCETVQQAVSHQNPYQALKEIEQSLYRHQQLLPLFHGKEKVTCSVEVQGVEISKGGYSDFYNLWINKNT
ncbi:ABC transporter substrate-binding protein [Vibrio bivalvicida]|uniref:ABC transporter substrate-binding protein n=1 Tax=Vibrio bivalvicida TaxID=1276888 RepID=A0A177Y2Z7_9VIBR|nr:ABC transporter substrate-binding protein [Vibrio bivalvicida]OAJ95191.1 ABC transporter substrate-binding protein [Vibrio bivalvicida]